MRTISSRGLALGSVLVLGLLVTTACGGSSHPAASSSNSSSPAATDYTLQELLPGMQSAATSAQSVRMAGTFKSGSQNLSIDMAFYGPKDVSGEVGEGGETYTLEVVGGHSYFEIDKAFLQAAKLPSSVCASLCGKYVEVPASEVSQMTGTLNLPALQKQIFSQMSSSLTRKQEADLFKPATLDGQPVLQYHGGGYTVDVSQSSPHYPLLLSDASNGTITFSEWNSVPAPTAPPAKDVLNLSQLGSSAS